MIIDVIEVDALLLCEDVGVAAEVLQRLAQVSVVHLEAVRAGLLPGGRRLLQCGQRLLEDARQPLWGVDEVLAQRLQQPKQQRLREVASEVFLAVLGGVLQAMQCLPPVRTLACAAPDDVAGLPLGASHVGGRDSEPEGAGLPY